jgi:hypothetical protein
MSRYRSRYMTAPPPSRFPAGFFEARDAFRDHDLDLFCEGTIRFIARAGSEVFGPFRSLQQALQWLASKRGLSTTSR